MEEIKTRIDDFVNDLFVELEDERGIAYGDIDPFDDLELGDIEETLANKILAIVEKMERYNR